MKKLLFILFIVVFLGSCKGEFDYVIYTITNDSLDIITFTFNDTTNTLDNGESITYTINSEQGRFIPENIIPAGHPRSVNLNTLNSGTAGIFYTFSDNIPLTLNVINTLSIPVKLFAYQIISEKTIVDYIYAEDEDINFILTIDGHAKKTAIIYTSKPNFTLYNEDESDTYPAIIDWKLTDDTTIDVIIK